MKKKKRVLALCLGILLSSQIGFSCAPADETSSDNNSQTSTDVDTGSPDSGENDVNVTVSDAEIDVYKMVGMGDYELVDTEITTVRLLNGEMILSDYKDRYLSEGYLLNEVYSGEDLTEDNDGKKQFSIFYYKEDLGLIDTHDVTSINYRAMFPNCNYVLEIYAETPYHAGPSYQDKERRRDVSHMLPSTGALSLSGLDGVYRLKASRAGKTCSVIFDAYDSTKPLTWNDASDANNVIYARGNRNFTGKLLTYKTVQLTEENHEGSYWEIHWNRYKEDGDGISFDSLRNGASMKDKCGFSVLARHSKAYYEKILEQYKWSTLSFSFKLNAVIDEETDQLQNGGTAALWPNTLYGNKVHTGYLTGAQLMGTTVEPKNIVEGGNYIGGGQWRTVEIRIKTLIENWDWMGANFTEGRGMDYFRPYYEANGLKFDDKTVVPIWRGTMVSWQGDWANNIKSNQLRDFYFTVGEFEIKKNEK